MVLSSVRRGSCAFAIRLRSSCKRGSLGAAKVNSSCKRACRTDLSREHVDEVTADSGKKVVR